MTDVEQREGASLTECEAVIERGLATFRDVGRALLRIRDERLYLAHHGTFEAYCQQRWQFERAHAYRLIAAAEVAEAVSPVGDITSERQARELSGLPAETAREVYAAASVNGKPTAAAIREAREQVAPRPIKVTETTKTETIFDSHTGEVLPADEWQRQNPAPHQPSALTRQAQAEQTSREAFSINLAKWATPLARMNTVSGSANEYATQFLPELASPYGGVSRQTLLDAAAFLLSLADVWKVEVA